MAPLAIAAALCSALIHASWNAALKRGRDRLAEAFLIGAGGLLVSCVILAALGLPARASWPFVGASSIAHLVYWAALFKGYDMGELSHIYTLSRGASPLLASLGAVLAAGEIPAPLAMLGIALVSAGVLCAGASPGAPWRASLWALAIGACIASYSLIDALGARASGSAPSYLAAMTAAMAVPMMALGLARAGAARLFGLPAPALARGLAVGVASAAGYGLVLWAQTMAPIARVTALRETSVVFAVLIAALVLRERVGPRRWAGAVLAVAGGALIALG
jgi:drug/metabolite transporter (DMT)-like permease